MNYAILTSLRHLRITSTGYKDMEIRIHCINYIDWVDFETPFIVYFNI